MYRWKKNLRAFRIAKAAGKPKRIGKPTLRELQTEAPINEKDFETVPAGEASSNLIKQVETDYPKLAEQARITGVVNLQLFIDRTGKVVGVKVRSGHPLLYQAAISATKQWRYRPFVRNHQPVNITTGCKGFVYTQRIEAEELGPKADKFTTIT